MFRLPAPARRLQYTMRPRRSQPGRLRDARRRRRTSGTTSLDAQDYAERLAGIASATFHRHRRSILQWMPESDCTSAGAYRAKSPMKILQSLLLVVVVLAGSACAHKSGNLRQVHGTSAEVAADAIAEDSRSLPPVGNDRPHLQDPAATQANELYVVETADAVPVETGTPASVVQGGAAPDEPMPEPLSPSGLSEAEQDATTLYEDAVVRDPWERYNRRIHRFNNIVDKRVLRPLAVGYVKAVPAPVRAGVSRFFGNLGEPATAINQALQGDPVLALKSLGRFAVNTTLGIGGVLDPATRMGLRDRGGEDFGQTLAVWGWRDSRYLVMPLLGPRTVRDSVAIVGDQQLTPIGYVSDHRAAGALQILEIVDGRTQLLSVDRMRQEAYDDYAFVRDAWAQRRKHQIEQDVEDD